MDVVFDPAKDAANVAKHGLSLADFESFDREPRVSLDDRFDYGERRLQARGRIGGKPYCIIYVETRTGI